MNSHEAEKNIQLEAIRHEVQQIKDRDGRPVEEGIKETVVFLKALGVNTLASCAGHEKPLNPEVSVDKSPEQGPFVQVGVEIPDIKKNRQFIISGGKTNHRDLEGYREKNEPQLRLVQELLAEFYQQQQPVSEKSRLTLRYFCKIPNYEMYREASLEGRGQADLDRLNDQEKNQYIKDTQKEIEAFTNFLKAKYFSGK